jgi:hypothetical protein
VTTGALLLLVLLLLLLAWFPTEQFVVATSSTLKRMETKKKCKSDSDTDNTDTDPPPPINQISSIAKAAEKQKEKNNKRVNKKLKTILSDLSQQWDKDGMKKRKIKTGNKKLEPTSAPTRSPFISLNRKGHNRHRVAVKIATDAVDIIRRTSFNLRQLSFKSLVRILLLLESKAYAYFFLRT